MEKVISFNLGTFTSNQFYLNPSFLAKYYGKQPQWSIISYITYKRTYARYIDDEARTEEFWETVQRVIEGTFSKMKEYYLQKNIPWIESEKQELAQNMYERIWQFKLLPAGRGLWMMGTEFVKKHGGFALNNCSFCTTENIDHDALHPFEWGMDCLMLGIGVGFDTTGKNKITIKQPELKPFSFVIPDSRKGWTDSVKSLLSAFFYGHPVPIFDYSQIRKKGERIKGFGGICEGYEPLKLLHDNLIHLLTPLIGQSIRSVDIIDIFDFIAKCVISGNVRRSALLSLGDITDTDFITCKQDQNLCNDRRANSNNSIIGKKGMDYTPIISLIQNKGEPAVVWLDNARQYSRMGFPADFKDMEIKGVNPCCEIGLHPAEICNLVESFPSKHTNYQDYEQTLFFAYLYAKIVTLFDYHWKETDAIVKKNRRIGISQSGIMNAYKKFGKEQILEWSNKGYNYLKKLDKEYSQLLQIPESIKLTTVKPSGSVSLLAEVSAGIHYSESEFYIRRIRFAEDSELIPILHDCGYKIEPDIATPNTLVVEFPIHEPDFYKSKDQVSIWEQVQNAVDYQHYWADNQISITVTFKESEQNEIGQVLKYCEDKLKGISFLKLNSHGYKQAPYEAISKESYDQSIQKLKPIPFLITKQEGEGENYCSGGICKTNL